VTTPVPVTTPAKTTTTAQTPAQVAAENAAFDQSMAAAHAAQASDWAAGVAALQAKVASGAVQVGSDAYNSTMDYLANLRGGVAGKAAGYADLHAAGLAGSPSARRSRFRVV
jgi:hypothetical protein